MHCRTTCLYCSKMNWECLLLNQADEAIGLAGVSFTRNVLNYWRYWIDFCINSSDLSHFNLFLYLLLYHVLLSCSIMVLLQNYWVIIICIWHCVFFSCFCCYLLLFIWKPHLYHLQYLKLSQYLLFLSLQQLKE